MKMLSLLVSLLSCLVAGCDTESPNARYAATINVYTVDGPACDEADLDEEGRVKTAVLRTAAIFCYDDGSPIELGGLHFIETSSSAEYYNGNWWPTDKMGVASDMVTAETGYATFDVWCEHWGVYEAQAGMSAKGRRTDSATVASGSFCNGYDPRTNWQKLIPWTEYATRYNQWLLTGGYWRSETPNFQSIAAATIAPPGPIAAASTFYTPPLSGFEVASLNWCMQGKNAKPINALTAMNHCIDSILIYRSTPYFVRATVLLSEPVDSRIEGISGNADLYAGDNYIEPISIRIASVSEDGFVLTVVSDYIIPIDARDYVEDAPQVVYDRWSGDPNDPSVNIHAPALLRGIDPNTVDENGIYFERIDPDRYVPVHCVPIESGQSLRIQFTEHTLAGLMAYVAENWLSDNRNLDVNEDGVFNYSDIALMLR